MLQTAVAGMEGEAAEPVKDRPTLMNLDRQRIVWPMSNHDIRPGIYRDMADLGHILQNLPVQPPMARSDDDVCPRAQCSDILSKPLQILLIGPGQNLRRQTRPVGGRASAMHRDLIGGVSPDHCYPGRVLT